MNMMPKEQVNVKEALKVMPPLIKGYLRLGAYTGDGAMIDRQFGTTDVLIVLPVSAIDTRYFQHFGAPDEVLQQPAATRWKKGWLSGSLAMAHRGLYRVPRGTK